MFQIERLKVVEETLKQVESELASGNVDNPEDEKEIIVNIIDIVSDIKHWLNTMRGGNG